MKTKITFFSLILFVTVFTFGQNAPEKKHGIFTERWKERHLSAPARDVNKNFHKRAFQNKRPDTQRPLLKSASANKQKLDSLVIFTKDEFTGQFVAYHKEEFTYDANGNLTVEIIYLRDTITSQWFYGKKTEFTYNGAGKLIQEINYNWVDTASQLVESWKLEYIYDGAGNLTLENFYHWDDITSQWFYGKKTEFTYNGAGNLTQEISYNWHNIEWVASGKSDYTYDGAGNLTLEIYYSWNAIANDWIGVEKFDYTYDGAGNLTLEIYYSWNAIANDWIGVEKFDYTYDGAGNLTQILYFSWNATTSQWIEDSKEEFTYNNAFSFNDLILPLFIVSEVEFYFNHMLTEIVFYLKDITDIWVQSGKAILYYSEHIVTNITNIESENIQLYPNPVSDYINFKFTGKSNSGTFELFDLQGRRLISKIITNNEQLSLKDLNKGMYLYIITIDGNRQNGKVIKE